MFVEDFDEGVFVMVLYWIGIVDVGGIVGIGWVCGWGIVSEVSKYCLLERVEGIGIVFDVLLRYYG